MSKRYTTPEAGQVWESKDEQYEPGRRVRVDNVRATRVDVTTVANPLRPGRVGATHDFAVLNLQKRWRLIATIGQEN